MAQPSDSITESPNAGPQSLNPSPRRGSLRSRILAFVGALVLLSLLGSSFSLYRITQVNRSLDAINRVSVPLGRLLVQLQSDAEIYRRELERRLGNTHWAESGYQPKAVPKWIEDVIDSELDRTDALLKKDLPWAAPETRSRWQQWSHSIGGGFRDVRAQTLALLQALEQKNDAEATKLYPALITALDDWIRQVHWGVGEHERSMRQAFARSESAVSELRTGLEVILVTVVALSLLLLWLGERTLRPLANLTMLARDITRRGLKKEDKQILPALVRGKSDEVSTLAREFHRMATVLLEREKVVESQKTRLEDQNKLLRDIGELNRNILDSIESVLLVTDLVGRVTQCNPVAAQWLGTPADRVIGTQLLSWSKLQALPGLPTAMAQAIRSGEGAKIDSCRIENRTYGGEILPLRTHAPGDSSDESLSAGAVIVLEDLTEELELEERLRVAENLAAVGRMSAQVAHEVRNPLHSIGLEAELAAELASKGGSPALKQSLHAILSSVDRLEKITENYLKLSRLSAGTKSRFDLGEALESVLATYASACESQGVRVDWSREAGSSLEVTADRDLIEQTLGNLMKNALQALEAKTSSAPAIEFKVGSLESGRVFVRIADNGPGIAPEVKERLFNPFVTTRAQGTGLGLSFVKKVIEDHGGTIEHVSTAVGTCFEIRLPKGDDVVTDSGWRITEVADAQTGSEVVWNG